MTTRRRALSALVAAVTAAPLALLVAPAHAQDAGARLSAEVTRTPYGAPHVLADNYQALGLGLGYAAAEDGLCDIQSRMLTVRGERSRWLGPEGGNLESDIYHKALIASGERQRLLDGPAGSPQTPSADARELVRGYVQGINKYLGEVGVDGIDDPRCQGQGWVVELSELDYWDNVYAGVLPQQVAGVANAQPPAPAPGSAAAVAPDDVPVDVTEVGSNAYGLGAESTRNGQGALLGNPHYPWDGQLRFVRMHTTIPGEIDVVGAGLIGTPFVGIGHNASMAWTSTVSTARRLGYFELDLAEGDPTSYVFEGETVAMTPTEVSVEVLQPSGAVERVTRTLYSTQFGRMVSTPTFPWTAERGFALRVPGDGLRVVDQYIAIAKARDVRELHAALGRYQATAYNVIAADADGTAFYGDMGAIPHVTDAKAEACIISDIGRAQWELRIPVLDGSRAECEWGTDDDSVQPGVFGASALPQIFRRDHVVQANDSYWLTNPEQPLVGFPRILGDEGTARSLRTRLAVQQVEQRVNGTDGLQGRLFDLERIQQVLFANRNHGAELTRDALVGMCESAAETDPVLAPACPVLAQWDLRVDVDSVGEHLFRLFVVNGGLRFAVPFDPADPLNTPNTLDTGPETVAALRAAVTQLNDLGIPLDAPWGSVQTEQRGDRRIPIHGGPGNEGVFNVITSTDLQPELGWTNVAHGSSWIMTVYFTPDGPRSEGVLAYSQSANPNSPHYGDQTELYSQEGWDDLRFSREAIERDAVRTYEVSVPVAAAARDTDDSCPAGVVPDGGFADVSGDNAHKRAIDCVVWWDVAQGRSSAEYAPAADVTRGQMATFIVRMIRESGKELPAPSTDYFPDDNGTTHEDSINRLREAGVIRGRVDGTYGPADPVNRDAMATFLIAATEYRTGDAMLPEPDYFGDDDGSAHEANINKAAAVGITAGTADGGYHPGVPVRRDQMASFIARVLDLLVEQGHSTTPA